MEAETASLRAFVFEAACLLGCEADEPGALESMIVELYAMRDRDVDGAIEIANLRAEVERLLADAVRSRTDFARSVAAYLDSPMAFAFQQWMELPEPRPEIFKWATDQIIAAARGDRTLP